MAVPVFTRKMLLKAQRMYLVEDMPPREIAVELGVEKEQLYTLFKRKGWAARKRKQVQEIDNLAEDTQASIISEDTEFRESLKIRAQMMVEQGLDIAESQSDARNFASAAAGTKNFMELYEKAAGMGGNVTQNVQNNTLNIMYVKPESDSKPSEDGEVTDI